MSSQALDMLRMSALEDVQCARTGIRRRMRRYRKAVKGYPSLCKGAGDTIGTGLMGT